MVTALRESDDSGFIHGVKRMRMSWTIGGEKEGEFNQPHKNWLTLGTRPSREDGSNNDNYDKNTAIDTVKKGHSGSSGLHSNWLTLRTGSWVEDESNKETTCIDAEKKDESSCTVIVSISSKEHGLNKQASIFIDHVPEDILNTILCKHSLRTLFQLKSVCTSWKTIISSSLQFHNLWDQCNKQMWLVMDQYDEKSGSSNALLLFDTSTRLHLRMVFNDNWRSSCSQWFLRAGDGGLLVYSSKIRGTLTVLNPLTMQYNCLEDARLSEKTRASFFMKKDHDDVGVHLKVDPKHKTYEVTVIIGNAYLIRKRTIYVLIYRSIERRWEVRTIRLAERVKGTMSMSYFPWFFVLDKIIYCFSKHGRDLGMYDLNGDIYGTFQHILGMQDVMHRVLGIVMYRSRIIMVCKTLQMDSRPQYLIFYEFDEFDFQWICIYKPVKLPRYLRPAVICCGGEYVWVIEKIDACINYIISINIDNGKLNIWPKVYLFKFNVRNSLSMPLSFCPSP